MSNLGKGKRKKAKVQNYEAKELWERSPSPAEDWGSDADRDFDLEVVGEEVVGCTGEIKYEVAWKDWKRADGSSTTWEGSRTTTERLPTSTWEAKRIAALPDTPDIVLWGTTDIANTATRERKQGYKETTDAERLAFNKDFGAMRQRMEDLLADKKDRFPELFPQRAARASGTRRTNAPETARAIPTQQSTRTPSIPTPRQSRPQVNAETGPSRPRVNAEAGPSRTGPSVPLSAATTSRAHVIPSVSLPSRLPAQTTPSTPTHRTAPPRRASPALSSSSTESIQFIDHIPAPSKPTPAPAGTKRKASSPVTASAPPLPKRRVPPRDPHSASGSASTVNIATNRDTASTSSAATSSRVSAASISVPHLIKSVASVPSKSPLTSSASCIRVPSIRTASTTAPPLPRASTSRTLVNESPPLPRRALKRKVPDDDDILGRVCACGTLLPPPDVYRADACDGCRTQAVNKRWKKDRERSTRVSVMRSTTTDSDRTLTNLEETTTPHASSSLTGNIRKGKAETVKSLRLRTETAWSAAAQKAGAAGITFVNEIEGDLEAVPPTLQGNGREFQYLEDQYTLSDTLGIAVDPKSPTPLTDGRFFSFCDHKDCKLELCQCQDPETVSYAYTDGLFNFTYGLDQVVVECNPYCDCEMEDCPNRVAQRPRQIHIEVFKTRRCGWGVRTTVDVEKGQVLGVYTGKLIRRAEAEQLTGLAKEYCFDLDYNEGGASIESLYSVDALKCGNWTRFINHSCAPNVRVQPVVYDTMPAQKIAFLAFIATQFIPARTEFTFDYDPEAQRAFETARSASDGKRRSSSKSQPPRPSEATDCVCGAELCRGWVRTT